jgi:ADP-ribosylglycohydrolase
MRLASVPIRYVNLFPDQLAELSRLAEESSLPTHASPQCLSACRYLTLVLCGLLHEMPREEVLDPNWKPLAQLQAIAPLHPEIAEVAAGSFRHKQPPEIAGSGYVVKSLEAALWAFHRAADFREAVLAAVNLGDDADTTGAVCGQLAGAYWGESGIPTEWRDGLARRDLIEQALDGLLTTKSEQKPELPEQRASRFVATDPREFVFTNWIPKEENGERVWINAKTGERRQQDEMPTD